MRSSGDTLPARPWAATARRLTAAAHDFPNDDTIQVRFAESLMDLSPWNYWEAGGSKPRTVLPSASSNATPAIPARFTIPSAPWRRRPIPRKPCRMRASWRGRSWVPDTSCTCRPTFNYPIGLYQEALQSNMRAIEVDESYFKRSDSDPVYKGAYYSHNIHFAMVSALLGATARPRSLPPPSWTSRCRPPWSDSST